MKPFKKGYLKQGRHKIYYEVYGNPQGSPWLFCHGGPGYHCVPKSNLKFFDLEKDMVILFDQRGAGKSLPHTELRENTTEHLVRDMRELLTILKVDKVSVFGGSWGSTLALVFAITYPNLVHSLIIRGIFLGRKEDVDAIYYPTQDWSSEQNHKYDITLKQLLREFKLKDIFEGFKILRGRDQKKSQKFAKLWACYEDLLCSRGYQIFDFDQSFLKMAVAISSIEMYYFLNDCFLPPNFILKNLSKIKNLPVSIVQGGDDMVCPKNQALELAQGLNNVELFIDPCGGHSNSDLMVRHLKQSVKKLRLNGKR